MESKRDRKAIMQGYTRKDEKTSAEVWIACDRQDVEKEQFADDAIRCLKAEHELVWGSRSVVRIPLGQAMRLRG